MIAVAGTLGYGPVSISKPLFGHLGGIRFPDENVPFSSVNSCEVVGTSGSQSFIDKLGGATLGGVVAGRQGQLAGALAAGHRSKLTLEIILKDGRRALIEGEQWRVRSFYHQVYTAISQSSEARPTFAPRVVTDVAEIAPLVSEILALPDLTTDTRHSFEGYKLDIENGDLLEEDAGYIRAFYQRVVGPIAQPASAITSVDYWKTRALAAEAELERLATSKSSV